LSARPWRFVLNPRNLRASGLDDLIERARGYSLLESGVLDQPSARFG
jgi:hypothetical protein